MPEGPAAADSLSAIHATQDRSLPFLSCLLDLYHQFRGDASGDLACYIPELARVDPDQFGIAVATIDGQIYEVGDSHRPFTIQSISKPFVYGLALADHGPDHVLARVGVEPSGDAFNSIVFDQRGPKPFNPMVNAGAIATVAMIEGDGLEQRWRRILALFERFAGRTLGVDEAVFNSEQATGNRNRAIAYLELSAGMIGEPVAEHLDLYFRQCSILIDARDLAMMAATLANNGVNPRTGERALAASHVRSVLSVMHSCGMYDFSGEWGFRVGMPAKSGVGGGILAVLPGQFGVGTFSPRLDAQGNSIRGIRVCEALSRSFNLHIFDSHPAAHATVRRSYSGATVRSKRLRRVTEQALLSQLGAAIQVYELQGDLFFASLEQLSRRIDADLGRIAYVILDGRRVARADLSAIAVMAEMRGLLDSRGITLLVAGFGEAVLTMLQQDVGIAAGQIFASADEALEWCEDRLIAAEARGSAAGRGLLPLAEMDIAVGLDDDDLAQLDGCVHRLSYGDGDLIIREGTQGDAIYLLAAGSAVVRVRLPDGPDGSTRFKRLGAMGRGVTFGELALFDGGPRAADVIAGPGTVCYVLPVARLSALAQTGSPLALKLVLNIGRALSQRLRQANGEILSLEG